MKEEEGLVIGVNPEDGTATVKVGRHEDCSACGACAGSRQMTVEAVNGLGAVIGQRVKFSMQEQQMLKGAFVVFLLPLILAGLGGLIGWQLGYGGEAEDLYPMGLAFLGFCLGSGIVKWYDKRASARQNEQPVITEIIS
ncbi:SoxR reducing system RseC family protein [Selenomonas sp. KH1T6]|uniref:SoxR reducing system RseC family protein n=1 Tax=Selenomonas sp. KH1T6 TaxID=3158784 RepID=UPI0008A7A4C3|nr:positive regulator of sigma(E), RseC/MucC [Selenomonas ruminantium]